MRACFTMSKPGRRYNMNTAHRGMNPFYVYIPAKVWNRPSMAVSMPVEAPASVAPVRSFWKELWSRIKAFFALLNPKFW